MLLVNQIIAVLEAQHEIRNAPLKMWEMLNGDNTAICANLFPAVDF